VSEISSSVLQVYQLDAHYNKHSHQ
jgi:hypothetical protein